MARAIAFGVEIAFIWQVYWVVRKSQKQKGFEVVSKESTHGSGRKQSDNATCEARGGANSGDHRLANSIFSILYTTFRG